MCNNKIKIGFTLAEVLITLGVIGVVAALTIPTLSAKIQDSILKNQFKTVYSKLYNAFYSAQTENGMPVNCFYWDEIPSQYCQDVNCTEQNQYGTCTAWECNDEGVPISNGQFSDCSRYYKQVFNEKLKVQKYCENNALANGCLTDDYHGIDTVEEEQNQDTEDYLGADPGQNFSTSNIKNVYPAYVLADGTVLVQYYTPTSRPVFMVDINGFRGPNKWGHDIFAFNLSGNSKIGFVRIAGWSFPIEEGGKSFSGMYNEVFR